MLERKPANLEFIANKKKTGGLPPLLEEFLDHKYKKSQSQSTQETFASVMIQFLKFLKFLRAKPSNFNKVSSCLRLMKKEIKTKEDITEIENFHRLIFWQKINDIDVDYLEKVCDLQDRNGRNYMIKQRDGNYRESDIRLYTNYLEIIVLYGQANKGTYKNTISWNKTTAKTAKYKIAVVRSFFKYIIQYMRIRPKNIGFYDLIVTPQIRDASSLNVPGFLSKSECKNILNNIAKNKHYERNSLIIYTFLLLGLRMSELIGINIEDITKKEVFIDGKSYKVEMLTVNGKGNKNRSVFLPEQLNVMIEAYINNSRAEIIRNALARQKMPHGGKHPRYRYKRKTEFRIDHKALFLSKDGIRLSESTVSKTLRDIFSKSGVNPDIHVHSLRHTAATHLYQSKLLDLKELADFLGHTSTRTTEIYTHSDKTKIVAAMRNHPLTQERLSHAEKIVEITSTVEIPDEVFKPRKKSSKPKKNDIVDRFIADQDLITDIVDVLKTKNIREDKAEKMIREDKFFSALLSVPASRDYVYSQPPGKWAEEILARNSS